MPLAPIFHSRPKDIGSTPSNRTEPRTGRSTWIDAHRDGPRSNCAGPGQLLYVDRPQPLPEAPFRRTDRPFPMGGKMRRRRIYEGKAKVLFEGPQPGTLVQYFKDDATAFNAKKRGVITGKGVLNNRISE